MGKEIENRRLLAPDFIKGIAIVLMVYGHLTMVGTFVDVQNLVTGWIYSFHMPLFLIVSGMFFAVDGDPVVKAKRLSLRIGIPYLIFISIYLLGLILIQQVGISTSNLPPDSISSFLVAVLFRPYGGYWFLHSLLLIQLALLGGYWVASLMKKESMDAGWFLAIIFLFGLSAFGLVQSRTIAYFLIGMIIRFVANKRPKIPLLLAWGAVPIIFVISSVVSNISILTFGFAEITWCVSIFVGLYAVGDHFSNSSWVRFIAWIGRNSLSILVFHSLFIVLSKPVAGPSLRLEPTGVLYSFGATFIVTALCLISAWSCDKLRMSRFLFASSQCYIPFRNTTKEGGTSS
ncbi:acyltransferase [Pontiellaceae bacterium B12219]|nr:acyltransferase [Pontiellaceae bacterium B12219]